MDSRIYGFLTTINDIIMVYIVLLGIKMLYMPVNAGLFVSCLWEIPFIMMIAFFHSRCLDFLAFTISHAALLLCVGLICILLNGTLLPDMIVAFICVVISYYSRMVNGSGRDDYLSGTNNKLIIEPGMSMFVYYFLIFGMGAFLSNTNIQKMAFVGEVISVVLIIIYKNAVQVGKSLVGYHNRDAVPYNAVRRIDLLLMAPSVLVSMAIMIMAANYEGLFVIGQKIKEFIFMILRFIFSLFPRTEIEEFSEESSAPAAQMDYGNLPQEADNPVIKAIWNILFVIASIAVTILIIWLLFKAVTEFIRFFNEQGRNRRGEKREYLNPKEVHRKSVSSNKKGLVKRIYESYTPAQRMRRIYKKYIESGSGASDIRESHTPYELEMAALGHGAEEELHALYEKARYNASSVSKKDLEKLKSYTR
ncbi:MAG: hypothetical protein K6B41_00835 [Butyrivibrio sp.]|nr:hypothetical protein [Butyrivibrio sp.]